MQLKTLSTLAFALTTLSVSAQGRFEDRFVSDKKGSLIGFSSAITSYETSKFSPGVIPAVKQANAGASLMYWQGITSKLDFSVRLNTIFTDYNKKDAFAQTTFVPELAGELHLKALKDNHLFNPFISAGIGAGYYSKEITPFIPVGLGLQLNVFNEVYVFAQAQYRISLATDYLDDNSFYGIGFAVPIKNATPKAPPTPKDTDGDGVPDAEDLCPEVAGPIALKGCPDADGDGIADKDDKCPTVAGLAKYDGCPIPDTDGDGINDEEDKCPTVAGLAKYGGCPIPDTDGDGVNDEEDKCPTVAGPASNKGCPEVKEETKQQLKTIGKAILFETGKATIKPASYKVLDQMVDILNEHSAYVMEIKGYTDNTGNADKNLILSKDRAAAVKNYLIEKGINADRLTSEGYGQADPIADNKNPRGRAENRRVEMELKMK